MTKTLQKILGIGLSVFSVTGFANTNSQPCHILVMGDSLSASYGLAIEQGWVHLLGERLESKNPECKLTNASVSGETSNGGKTRLPALLKQHKPTLMILELGANDGLRGLPLDNLKNNLENMIHAAQENNTQVVLLGMKIPANYGKFYTQRFENTFAEIAKVKKLPFVPFFMKDFAQDPNAFQTDGIHPNAKSQEAMLNAVWPSLKTTLNQSKTKN
jgi:acyl-CoA thioesterase-1